MSPNPNAQYKILIARLRDARKAAGLSQADAANLVKQHQTFISKVEKNERRIDPIELLELARAYNTTVTDLLDFAEAAEAPERSGSTKRRD